jgi:hypothetical protein
MAPDSSSCGIVADGRERLEAAPEYQASLQQLQQQLRQQIRDRYATQLAAASWLQQQHLNWQIRRELRNKLRRRMPSPYALF